MTVVSAVRPCGSRATIRCWPGTSGQSIAPPASADPTTCPATVHSMGPRVAATTPERQRLELAAQGRIDQIGGAIRWADDGQRRARRIRSSRQFPVGARGADHRGSIARPRRSVQPLRPGPLAVLGPPERQQAVLAEMMPAARPRWRLGRDPFVLPQRAPGGRRRAESAQISRRTTLAGSGTIGACEKAVDDPPRRRSAASITAWKIGAAPVTPLELRSGVRSKLPTHTPTVTPREWPIVRLS
jgi:hypothetical protein